MGYKVQQPVHESERPVAGREWLLQSEIEAGSAV